MSRKVMIWGCAIPSLFLVLAASHYVSGQLGFYAGSLEAARPLAKRQAIAVYEAARSGNWDLIARLEAGDEEITKVMRERERVHGKVVRYELGEILFPTGIATKKVATLKVVRTRGTFEEGLLGIGYGPYDIFLETDDLDIWRR